VQTLSTRAWNDEGPGRLVHNLKCRGRQLCEPAPALLSSCADCGGASVHGGGLSEWGLRGFSQNLRWTSAAGTNLSLRVTGL